MGIFRRLGSMLKFLKDDSHRGGRDGGRGGDFGDDDRASESFCRKPDKGFGVQVPVAIDKAIVGPIIVPCVLGEGGVQGFRWYGRRLRIDEDGDVADEFLTEILTIDTSISEENVRLPSFEVKCNTRPAPVRKQAFAINGNVHPSMEYKGMLSRV